MPLISTQINADIQHCVIKRYKDMSQKTLLISFLLVVVSLIVGFVAGRGGTTSVPGSGTQELPISVSFLTSPTVSQWRADMEGTLIAKTGDSFTLEQDGGRITISVSTSALFYNATISENGRNPEVALADIPIGTTLKGGAFVAGQGKTLEANVFYMVPTPAQ